MNHLRLADGETHEVICHTGLSVRRLRWAEVTRYFEEDRSASEFVVDLFEEWRDALPSPVFATTEEAKNWALNELDIDASTWVAGPSPRDSDPKLPGQVEGAGTVELEHVERFAGIVRSAAEDLRQDLRLGVDEEPVGSLLRSSERSHGFKAGYLSSGTIYRCHGIGVSFTTTVGHVVEVDLVQGEPAWDAWRLGTHACYGALDLQRVEACRVVMEEAATLGLVKRVKVDWYGLVG